MHLYASLINKWEEYPTMEDNKDVDKLNFQRLTVRPVTDKHGCTTRSGMNIVIMKLELLFSKWQKVWFKEQLIVAMNVKTERRKRFCD